jgi:hypothetical protein
MVVLDNSAVLDRQKVPLPKISLPAAVAFAAMAIVIASWAVRGFSDNGFRLASQNAWRFAALVFFAALMVGPLGRLVPALRRLEGQSRFLTWGFCASYGVYLVSVLLPNGIGAAPGASIAVTVFILFGGGVTLVMALARSPHMAERIGPAAQRALLGVSVIYFWLCYALMGLAHLSHPHRPDAFYGYSLSLMIVALLACFADRFRAEHGASPRAKPV